MRLTMHSGNVGVTDDGEWFQRKPEGKGWQKISKPMFVVVAEREKANEKAAMADPFKRSVIEIPMVKVRRVIEKTVPDYEAAVLARNGWEIVPDE